jgi:putative phage-type endonuclease
MANPVHAADAVVEDWTCVFDATAEWKLTQKKLEQLCKLKTSPQRSEEWFQERSRLCITASNASSAIGELYDYKTRDVKKNKIKEVHKQLLDTLRLKPKSKFQVACNHGTEYEDQARRRFMYLTNLKVYEFGLIKGGDMEKIDSRIGGSFDGFCSDGALLEIKCPWSGKINGIVPGHHDVQMQVLMALTGVKKCYYFQYVPESLKFSEAWKLLTVEFNQDKWDTYIYPRLLEFCDLVDKFRFAKDPSEVEFILKWAK